MAAGGNSNEGAVRALSRGLTVLQVINRGGSVRMADICEQAQLPNPTAHRIVKTLIEEGMVEREEDRKRYRPTALVRTLSYGYQADDELITVARPHIVELCREVNWPISLAKRVGNKMMVRDSTHAMTSLTFTNYAPGYTLPLIECSTGKAYLAFCEKSERQTVIAGFGQLDERNDRMAQLLLGNKSMLEGIRRKGYATQARNLYTDTPGKTSSIAVPIGRGSNLHGCLALIFFAEALSMEEAERRYSERLMETSRAISAAIKGGDKAK